ncbi:hypothetical protein C4577_02425 [Candidatus Parcubacteria bacterium]|nr:MAG: hypothetical protein C4577_02425 [Candidatus Parcubacteria bacterium]
MSPQLTSHGPRILLIASYLSVLRNFPLPLAPAVIQLLFVRPGGHHRKVNSALPKDSSPYRLLINKQRQPAENQETVDPVDSEETSFQQDQGRKPDMLLFLLSTIHLNLSIPKAD